MKKYSNKKGWMPVSKKVNPKVPENVKSSVNMIIGQFINDYLKPKYIQPPPENRRFNYITDIFSRWHHHYLHLCTTYNSPHPDAISPSFELKFTRLEYISNDCYNMSYMRHTGQWREIYRGMTLDECIETIKEDSFFAP